MSDCARCRELEREQAATRQVIRGWARAAEEARADARAFETRCDSWREMYQALVGALETLKSHCCCYFPEEGHSKTCPESVIAAVVAAAAGDGVETKAVAGEGGRNR